ncbi:CAP domain-containing protein [Sediminitomix flava]|uniref:Cysteine-rich secretory protein family protein n=1 Tax=Sediminitomix flava TaxID=379075 RepID=A0A315Z770_SEDFL|nr:CAP domain-containing protein [Sediminitomix flava]PWJ40761.1 Cysteine-rich secretory protein family protein [Sediminitomix flava]
MKSFFLKRIGYFLLLIQLAGCGELLFESDELISHQGCATGDEFPSSEFESKELNLFDQINALRASEGLATFTWDEGLVRSARYHAQDMAKDDYFNVDTYDRVDGQLELQCTLSERIVRFNQNAKGENIAFLLSSPTEVIQTWLDEEGFRENLLSPVYQAVGIGYYSVTHQSKEIQYWVMDVGIR